MASYANLVAALCFAIYAQEATALPHVDPELLHARLTFKEWDEIMKSAQEQVASYGKSKETHTAPQAESARPISAETGGLQPAVDNDRENTEEKRARLGRLLPAIQVGKDGRATMSLSQYLRLSPFVKRAMQTNRQPLRFG